MKELMRNKKLSWKDVQKVRELLRQYHKETLDLPEQALYEIVAKKYNETV